MKLIEYKCPFHIFSSGEKKLLLIFCISSWLQKPENGSYETLVLPCGLNIKQEDSILGDQKNSHGKPKEDAALFKMKRNNRKKCRREKLHHSRICKIRESDDVERPFFLPLK